MKNAYILSFLLLPLFLLLPVFDVLAHEAYVLPTKDFNEGLAINAVNPLAPLIDPAHLAVFILISIGVATSYVIVFLLSTTRMASLADQLIRKARVAGPFIIRLAISFSLFSAAQYNIVFGPELSLAGVPLAALIRFLLFLAALMIFFGVFTELGAAIGIVLFGYAFVHFGPYLITYTNYFGELIVLLLFGSRTLSFDKLFFRDKRLLGHSLSKVWETPIVRIFYGTALVYAGYTIKFLHQGLSVSVYNEYHLQNFFHASASFIAAGAGLSEITIGVFLILGFAMRWTIFISLVFITLSILYFQELLWPHVLLYGISISLFINAGDFLTLEHRILPWLKGKISKKPLHITAS